jgi:uncharacterized membrane protein SpoIIM required for sporulation
MIRSEDRRPANGQASIAASTLVWNTVVPALGLVLILGAAVLPAIVIAAAASIAIVAVLAPDSRRREWRSRMPARVASHRVARAS